MLRSTTPLMLWVHPEGIMSQFVRHSRIDCDQSGPKDQEIGTEDGRAQPAPPGNSRVQEGQGLIHAVGSALFQRAAVDEWFRLIDQLSEQHGEMVTGHMPRGRGPPPRRGPLPKSADAKT